ncbi:MAG: DUF6261 family protein [Bacteroidales bacterium]|jgi:hypothetical protein|nr:DUF6261 family protein [Bacteroidales bacterium]
MEENNIVEINYLNSKLLRNNEHYQFLTEFKDLVESIGTDELKITADYASFTVLHKQENESIQKIFKSEITEKRLQADRERDNTFRGMADTIKGAKNHFNVAVSEAAGRMEILFKTYGNVARKPYNEETAAIHTLLAELNGKYAADVKLLGLKEWVNELEQKNNTFDTLTKVRFTELGTRTELKSKEVREEIDKIYYAIVKHINALMLIEKSSVYINFIHQWNVRIKVYNDLLAQRKGRSDAKKDNDNDEED